MSHRDKDTGTVYIVEELPGKCELCGAIEETRPYGPNGVQICYTCGCKDVEQTEKMMGKILFGDEVVD